MKKDVTYYDGRDLETITAKRMQDPEYRKLVEYIRNNTHKYNPAPFPNIKK
ncbi:hypothetical protein IEO70_05265 [Bacillus sp. AGMB 02131]|uniref:Uncharacterized protein n=1 Tax=Peribacillus faecalis TaxID=2772559 RepID=A0A927HAC0_9BACI|nr:hypothetical protein [Peribacillus faecalis]MBD3107769.1 hypothetical protein [Peribacillus faecalis]